MTYEEYKAAVVEIVTERLKESPWFQGVCVDRLEIEYEFGTTVEYAARIQECMTIFNDSPPDLW